MEDRVERAAREVVDAVIEVHRALGPGYLESVYEEALAVELEYRGVRFRKQVSFDLTYRGRPIGVGRIDLIVDECLVVELKAVDALTDIHLAQVISYLKATKHRLGLLINFNVSKVATAIRRVAL